MDHGLLYTDHCALQKKRGLPLIFGLWSKCEIGINFLYFRVTCVYLAAKVEEFNVSIAQFVANVKGDREKASDIIINNELLLMAQIDFQLAIHNPFRPVEGLIIDIKVIIILAYYM